MGLAPLAVISTVYPDHAPEVAFVGIVVADMPGIAYIVVRPMWIWYSDYNLTTDNITEWKFD